MKSKATLHRFLLLSTLALLLQSSLNEDPNEQMIEQAQYEPGLDQEIEMAMRSEGIAGNEQNPETGHTEHDNLELDGPATNDDPGMNTIDPDVGSEDLANEENFINDPEALEQQTPEQNDPTPYLMTLADDDEMTKMRNYKAISEDLKMLEEQYKEELMAIPAIRWNENAICNVVGIDFTKIVNDISKGFWHWHVGYSEPIYPDQFNKGYLL